jgi:hypothetical protein
MEEKMTNLEPMKIAYEQYLFAQLWAVMDSDFAELPYDIQWDEIPSKWRAFENSGFNDPERPLYDCIISFFENEQLL